MRSTTCRGTAGCAWGWRGPGDSTLCTTARQPCYTVTSVNTRKFLVDGNMHVKLTGFGLTTTRSSARKHGRSSRRGRPSSTRHTVTFVAPERMGNINTPYDDRAESYSFGIVLHEIASRELPFKDMSQTAIAEFVKAGKTEDVPADCPAKFRHVIDACRAFDPALRPLSAEIADGLQDAFIQSVSKASS
ncbi:mixed lineage kinase domain-like protein [Branchiostoma floridae]|uniref:Mixed lineage kinase domain-like protein n=1 Tax=Branchiostoma floridae TaxID=7739 RepID=A0A9J7MSJ7_BRAFL|nr:mixed lineage kinase domain-like protein [Branchiostoma floridae]